MNSTTVAALGVGMEAHGGGLQRKIDWRGAFWVASGVPALVLFSIGAIAATVGKPAWIVWTVSIVFGFVQAFTYAEIAGLFPAKSGGASIYGAVAWVRYGKMLAPVSVWCNWFAWSPVLAIGSGLTAGYVLIALFPDPQAAINIWQWTLAEGRPHLAHQCDFRSRCYRHADGIRRATRRHSAFGASHHDPGLSGAHALAAAGTGAPAEW